MKAAAAGHRPQSLTGFDNYWNHTLPDMIKVAIHYLTTYKVDSVYTGLALGWETAIGVAAVSMEIEFVVASAYPGQENPWKPRARDFYRALLDRASRIEYPAGTEKLYAPYKMAIRNQWIINNTDIVLALWNGNKHGAAYSLIQYANKQKRPIKNAWEFWSAHYGR